MKGGVRWKEGTDTCIYKPAVRCKGDDLSVSYPNHVSRIVPRGSVDETVENHLKHLFPMFVNYRWISVFDKVCVPRYVDSDIIDDVSFHEDIGSGCSRVPQQRAGINLNHQNLIAPLYGSNFLNVHKVQFDVIQCLFELQPAFVTALNMVRTDGSPWIIHTDLHAGNLLKFSDQNHKPRYALHDWGRVIMIGNPGDLGSVQRGLKRHLELLKDIYSNPHLRFYPLMEFRAQSPPVMVHAFNQVLKSSTYMEALPHLHIVRSWTLYSLMYMVLCYTTKKYTFDATTSWAINNSEFHKFLSPLLTKPSSLDVAVNEFAKYFGWKGTYTKIGPDAISSNPPAIKP